MKISVLGTEYDMSLENDLQDHLLKGLDGYCNSYAKKIAIRPMEELLDGEGVPESERKCRYEQVKRHELVHAFLYESGLENYSVDECIVDWIALQANKLAEAFKTAEQL